MTLDIKARLRELGLKQRVIARQLGVSDAALSLWVSGQQRVPAERAKALAQLLDVPPGAIRPDLWDAPPAAVRPVAA